jgi:hypothetical protein
MGLNRVEQTVEKNKSQGEQYRLPCGRCHVETRHIVLQSVDVNGKAVEWDYYFSDQYQIVQCQGCEAVSFRKNHTNSEDMAWDEENQIGVTLDHEELYPSRVAGRHKLWRAALLPPDVSRIYDETHAALCNKHPILAGIGIRALVETVCKEKGTTKFKLVDKIDELVSMGVLTHAGALTLHRLRVLGNDAAHEVKPHSEETLGIAMDVVEHLLNDVYILPSVANRLPKP